MPLQPASSGPVRYWQDRGRLAAKCALAAVAAWVLARYAAGQHDPYFAPLAALAGVSSTVARSSREGIQYVGVGCSRYRDMRTYYRAPPTFPGR